MFTDNWKNLAVTLFFLFLFLTSLWAEQFFVKFELKDKITFHLANQNENLLIIPFIGESLWRRSFMDKGPLQKALYYQAEFVIRKSLLKSRGKNLDVDDFVRSKGSELALLKQGYESENNKISSIRMSLRLDQELKLLESPEFKNLLIKTYECRKIFKKELNQILNFTQGPKPNLRALILYESFASKVLDGATAHDTYEYLKKKYPLKNIDRRNSTKYFNELFIDNKETGLKEAVEMAIEYAKFLGEDEIAETISNIYK